MNRYTRITLAAAAACALAQPAAAQTVLTMSSWVSPSHPLTKVFLQGWADQAEKATGGRVRFQMLPKAPVAPPGTFDAVRDDLVDLSYVTASYTPARFLLTKLGELPGGGATATVNSIAYSRVHYKYFAPADEYKGVHLLGVFTHGPGQIFNSKHEVASLADLKGLKIRTGGGIAADMGKAMGATLMFKPAPLAYTLLKEGVADGVFFPLESPASFHLEKLIHYATLFHGGFYSSTFGFFMNPGKWDALPQRDKDALNKVSGEYVARFAGHMWDAADKVGLAAIKKANVKITHASPAFEAEVKALAKTVIEDWYKAAARRNVDGPKAFAMYHAEIDKLEARMKK